MALSCVASASLATASLSDVKLVESVPYPLISVSTPAFLESTRAMSGTRSASTIPVTKASISRPEPRPVAVIMLTPYAMSKI